jgi:hypothetical protein
MPHRISSVLLAAGAASAVAVGIASIGTAGAHPAAQAAALSCSLRFTATPRIGPDRGDAQSGVLTIHEGAAGAVSGTLAQTHGKTSKWHGQLNGQAISMIILVPHKCILFGTGMLAEPLSKGHCGMTAGGTFSGPREGDIGDWLSRSNLTTSEGCPPGALRVNSGIGRTGTAPCLPSEYFN